MCGTEFIKCLVFLFNVVLTLSGIALIGLGVLFMVDVRGVYEFTDQRTALPIVLLVTGSLVFVIAFLGCCGAMRESRVELIAFIAGLAIVLIMELTVGIIAFIDSNQPDLETNIRTNMNISMKIYTTNHEQKKTWDDVQNNWRCCGVDSYKDWPEESLPLSCCHANRDSFEIESPNCEIYKMELDYVNSAGCFEKLKNKVNIRGQVLFGVGVGNAAIHIIGIFLGSWILCAVQNWGHKSRS